MTETVLSTQDILDISASFLVTTPDSIVVCGAGTATTGTRQPTNEAEYAPTMTQRR